MSLHIHLSTLIDRANLSRQVNPKCYSLLLEQISDMPELSQDKEKFCPAFLSGWKIKKYPMKYGLRVDFFPKKSAGKIMEMLAFSNKNNVYFFTLGLYPGHFSTAEYEAYIEKIKTVFDCLMPFTYADIYENAKVSYLELATDNSSQEMGTFLVSRSHTGISSRFIEEDGFLGSHYLGSVNSNCRVCIYDKNRQLAKFGYPVSGVRRTRIEVRLRRTGLHASELAEKLGNPFSKLHVADLAKAYSLAPNNAMIQFLKQANLIGTAAALKLQTPKNAYLARALLKAAKSWWWNPDCIGKYLPGAFAQLLP